jgi:hypothetical protein
MIGERVWLQAAGDPAPTELDAIVDLDGAVVIARERMPWSGTRLALLGRLVDAGPAGMSLEEMYLQVWQGRAYQALEHRNMVYVTLQRVRSALKRLLGDEPLEHIDDARYALTARFRLGVRRPVDREWLRRFIVRRTREVVAPRSPALRPLGRSTAIES